MMRCTFGPQMETYIGRGGPNMFAVATLVGIEISGGPEHMKAPSQASRWQRVGRAGRIEGAFRSAQTRPPTGAALQGHGAVVDVPTAATARSSGRAKPAHCQNANARPLRPQ
jgi:hypothetical protein